MGVSLLSYRSRRRSSTESTNLRPRTYPTERDVRLAVQGQLAALNADTLGGKANVTFGMVIDRYLKEEFPSLRHSTQTTIKSLLELHIPCSGNTFRWNATPWS